MTKVEISGAGKGLITLNACSVALIIVHLSKDHLSVHPGWMRLVVACVLALMSSDEEDGFPVPAYVKRRLGGSSAASTFNR